MKICKLEINKFRSIDHIEIEIEKITSVIGENNSGKSSILRAIELFYEESIRSINEEFFFFKNENNPIEIILTFNSLSAEENEQKYIKHWICDGVVRIKKQIECDPETKKYSMTLFGWQKRPTENHFDLSKFEDFKGDIKNIVKDNGLPDYFLNDKGNVTQQSYKDGVARHIDEGQVEFGVPDWLKNPGGLKENFSSLLPRFYFVPAMRDANDESKTTQQTIFGKLISDLTNRIVSKNPKFEEVKKQLDGLQRFLNRKDDGNDDDRLQEIRELEKNLSDTISENIPNSKVQIEIVTPELIDLFKDTKIRLDDSLSTSIESKGHGLQRALVFAYIRAYAKTLNALAGEGEQAYKNFILGIEEPELCLHPNGQRKMLSVLENISSYDQVIYCTHSNFFVNMFDYNNIVIVRRDNNGPCSAYQYRGDIFEAEEAEAKKRLKKVFRYLSLFDLSRSELFFSRKVVLVEGDTEKFIIPFWATRLTEEDKKFDFSSNNISIVECGGKTNMHIFMRVLNRFRIPYVVIHDVDPIDFEENKQDKTDKEKQQLRMFHENTFISNALDGNVGKIIQINPELETVVNVSKSQADKEGKVAASFLKYEEMPTNEYHQNIITIIESILSWEHENNSISLTHE
ncbi:MAG: AAA family ATPase [Desulfobacteraceae bacterium]|nr:AAA family ATPase [Desulfobacteraceae bacterium]